MRFKKTPLLSIYDKKTKVPDFDSSLEWVIFLQPCLNSNIELRSSKQIRNSNFQNKKIECTIKYSSSCFLCLEFWSFGIVSDFVLRISNFLG